MGDYTQSLNSGHQKTGKWKAILAVLKFRHKPLQSADLALFILVTAIYFLAFPLQQARAQMPDLGFEKSAPAPDGLWINRTSPPKVTPAPKHFYRDKKPQGRMPSRFNNKRTEAPSYQEKVAIPGYRNQDTGQRYRRRTQTNANNIQAEELPPLNGTQQRQTVPNRFPQQGGRSRFNPYQRPASLDFNSVIPLTGDVWRDISMAQFEKVIPHLKLPIISFTYQNLVAQLFLSKGSQPSGTESEPQQFLALRLDTLYRAGLLGTLRAYLKSIPPRKRSPLTQLYDIKTSFALGRDPSLLCEDLADIVTDGSKLPKQNFGDLILYRAYCTALEGNSQASQLAAELAREQGVSAPIAFAAIDYLSGMGEANFPRSQKLLLRDFLFMILAKAKMPQNLVHIAEPALLHYLSHNNKVDSLTRGQAAEKVVQLDLLDSRQLARAYQNITEPSQHDSPLLRANMYQSILTDAHPERKARKIQLLLKNAKDHKLAMPIARILLPHLKKIPPQKNMDWFAHDAAEIAILAEDFPLAMRWIMISRREKAGQTGSVANLFILMEIADPKRTLPKKSGLLAAEDLAKSGYLTPFILHRLVTVLDALAYNIPIPLWEAASQTPQPQKGYLPPSGALSALRSAAKSKAPARTILMAIEATGPKGATDVHLIGLRDIIQNLRKAGYEQAARRIGFEALYSIWPKR